MTIRILAKITLIGLALLGFHSNAAAQEYPTRSVKIVVGYPPGGSVDANARLLGQLLSEHWKQPVVVENRAGAEKQQPFEYCVIERVIKPGDQRERLPRDRRGCHNARDYSEAPCITRVPFSSSSCSASCW